MINITVTGAAGRMGKILTRLVLEDPDCALFGAIEAPGHPSIGADAGAMAGLDTANVRIGTEVPEGTAVIIDFSTPDAIMPHLDRCADMGCAAVIGTTGFTPDQRRAIITAGMKIPVILSPNFAIGVNLLFQVAAEMAKALGEEFDIEIVEMHHRDKVDAPSGTALGLAESISGALGWDKATVLRHGRMGRTGARPVKEIGMHSLRGGGEIGEHSVIFASDGERIQLSHRAQSREAFASGALRAAKFLDGQKPGVYTMAEVLGLGK
jgi:4-hydroxy-tetrahydrodipicolinate reductase